MQQLIQNAITVTCVINSPYGALACNLTFGFVAFITRPVGCHVLFATVERITRKLPQ
jgi:hypothetical protein